jgi:hypothetical protein
MCSDSVARPIMQDSHSCDWGSNPHRSMRVLKLFFKAYLPLLTLIWIIFKFFPDALFRFPDRTGDSV